ncbi:MAG: DUF3467 domain-containing protein [Candidatus Marinimicrobia bacterium]|nr:DUF3467 domain-containing protein [Candidatus Neomarinimicrobiota bacterium]
MSKNKPKKNKQLQVELSEDKADGNYSNFTVISHSNAEFVIDFARIVPGVKKANVKSRIIMTPTHAKTLLYTLKENISRYEAQHGEIKLPENKLPFEGNPPKPQGTA